MAFGIDDPGLRCWRALTILNLAAEIIARDGPQNRALIVRLETDLHETIERRFEPWEQPHVAAAAVALKTLAVVGG